MRAAPLTDRELVAHVFVPLTGPHHPHGHAHLAQVWRRCRELLAIVEPTPLGLPTDLPGDVDGLPPRDGPVAAARRSGGGVHEMFAYRRHDMLCLSVVLAPGQATSWPALEADWARARGGEHPAVLGEVRLRLARHRRSRWGSASATAQAYASLRAELDGPDRPGPAQGASGRRLPPGADRPSPGVAVTSGGFVVWEASGLPDDRRLRRLVVVAPKGTEEQLSEWVWSSGRAEPATLTRYLLYAAMARYELRVWSAGQTRSLPHQVDARLARLLPLLDEAAEEDQPDPAQWDRYARRLGQLVADEAGLLDAVAELSGLRRTVQIATTNMATLVPSPAGAHRDGPFADDHALTTWFDQQLDDDLTYLRATLARTTSVGVLLDRSVRRWEAARRERYTLAQTALVGAVLMVLTAIQALRYQVPLPTRVQPAVVIGLGAVAFYLPLAVIRLASARRGGTTLVEHLALAALVATVLWAGLAWLANVVPTGWAWAALLVPGAFLTTWLALATRRAYRRRRAEPGPAGPAGGDRRRASVHDGVIDDPPPAPPGHPRPPRRMWRP
ncbi:CATRA conflict system CASPASE/TPR repeat-associated protein [Micromonospora haikouensis]|uniref:CATRA conflict system CASPASE/TPR repeat-associated protein n=1 Tax=Micromonospora haikouensis TaxID=686309 RepID=UPI003D764ED7